MAGNIPETVNANPILLMHTYHLDESEEPGVPLCGISGQ